MAVGREAGELRAGAGAGDTDILLADDEPLFTGTLRDILNDQGYTVITAANGVEALAQVQRHRPSLVVMDLAMPKMDGETACREILGKPAHPTVVILTAHVPCQQACRLLAMGAAAVLTKPVSVSHLLALVAEACGTDRAAAVPA